MNLTVLGAKGAGIAAKLIGKVKVNSPELLIGFGVAGVLGTVVLASKATLKLEPTLDELRDNIDTVKEARALAQEEPEIITYSERDYQLDLYKVYASSTFKIARLYLPSVLLGGLSIAAIAGSHVILKNRNLGLIAAYQAMDRAYNGYRQRVREELGEDRDMAFATSSTLKTLKDKDTGETTKALVRKATDGANPLRNSPYARFFDETASQWERGSAYNRTFLLAQQSMFNNLLQAKGHVFLNEVYDALGMDRSPEGQVVGWVISKDGDNFIDFGMYDVSNPAKRAFINGQESSILLDFNVDGVIVDKI